MVLCEQPPYPGSRLRNDIQVRSYDDVHDTISIIVIGEGKKHGGSVKDAEKQAEKSSKEIIEHHGLNGIYSLTFISTMFRVWYMGSDKILLPVHGENKRDDKKQYIDADSKWASKFVGAVSLIKGEPPLREANVILSHDMEITQEGWGEAMTGTGEESAAGYEGGSSGVYDYGAPAEASGSSTTRKLHKVTLKKHKQNNRTVYLFKDKKGDTISSEKAEWTREETAKGPRWTTEYKGRVYEYTEWK
jgi:hypothetical protein